MSKQLKRYLSVQKKQLILLNICCLLFATLLLHFYHSREFPFDESNIYETSETSEIPFYFGNVHIYKTVHTDCNRSAFLKAPNTHFFMCIFDSGGGKNTSSLANDSVTMEPAIMQAVQLLSQHSGSFNRIPMQQTTKKRMDIFKADSAAVTNQAENDSVEDRALSVVDLGCSVGAFTLSIAAMGGQVLALDPIEENLQLLAASLRMNNLTGLVTLVNNVVTEMRGIVHMKINAENKDASIVVTRELSGINYTGINLPARALSAVCLDDLVPYVRTGRVFLKMTLRDSGANLFKCGKLFFKSIDVQYVFMKLAFESTYDLFYYGENIYKFMSSMNIQPFHSPQDLNPLAADSYELWPEYVFWIKRK